MNVLFFSTWSMLKGVSWSNAKFLPNFFHLPICSYNFFEINDGQCFLCLGASNLQQTTLTSRRQARNTPPYVRFPAANTWTQKFFCLGTPSDCQTADRLYNLKLEQANLGSKKIKFNDKKGDHDFFMKRLCEEFPPLKRKMVL